MTNTTIMVTKELQQKLKILCALKDTTYENLIKEMIEIYHDVVPFNNKEEFVRWIKKGDNIKSLGFKKVINKHFKNNLYDLLVEDFKGNQKRIKIEINAKDFMAHKLSKVDYIVSAFSTKNSVKGIPVQSINNFSSSNRKLASIIIPIGLKKKLNELKAHTDESYQNTIQMLINSYNKSGGNQ